MSDMHQIIILFGGYVLTLNYVLKLVIPILYSCYKIMVLRIKSFLQAMPTSCLKIKAKKTAVTVGTFSVTVGT